MFTRRNAEPLLCYAQLNINPARRTTAAHHGGGDFLKIKKKMEVQKMFEMILSLAGFVFVIWFYIDTKKALEAIPEEMPEPIPAPTPYQAPPQSIQAAPIQAPTPAPFIANPAPMPAPAPAAALINRQQLERAARDCLTLSGCKFDTYTYVRYKSDTELMDIIKEYNFNR